MTSVKERKLQGSMLLGLIGAILALVTVMYLFLNVFDNPGKKERGPKKAATQIMIAPTNADFESHEAKYNDRLLELETELKKVKVENRELKETKSSYEARFDKFDKKFKELTAEVNDLRGKAKPALGEKGEDGWPPADEILGKEANTAARKGFASGRKSVVAPTAGSAPSKPAQRLGVFHVLPPKSESRPVVTYLPSGTFAKARLLNGATAPTRGQGSGNPVPVLLEITDPAIMPNLYKAGIQKCFVTAHATGELASERVLIRTDRLSCIDGNGGAVDKKIQGYVTGEDGKTGLSARLVNKSGQAIANALMTGTLSGLGKAVSLASENQTTSITGTVSTTVTNPWRAGFGEGASHAMDRITDYYLKLASDIFPVLEIDSGRQVEVVISQGVSIEKTANPAEEANPRRR